MKKLTTFAIAGAAGAAIVLSGATSANAAIKPGKGIAGIKIGDSKSTVINKKGQPNVKKTLSSEILGSYKYFEYGLNELDLGVSIYGGKVFDLITEDPSQRTTDGIGVNSSKQEIKAAYPDAKCEKVSGSKKICTLGKLKAGKTVTVFRITGKVVHQVEVGKVID